jgi:hypothetical protein
MKSLKIVLLSLLSTPAFGATALFNITINYTGDPQYLPIFQQAESIWESIIPSYINGHQGAAHFDGITISASIGAIDGAGGILGGAQPTFGGYDDSGYLLATAGEMEFDSADVDGLGSALTTVILHEMGHVLGIGTLWTQNGLYVNGTGQYTGANGLAAYRTEFNQPNATFVPVELGGGAGTANAHWNEVDGGAAATGLVSSVSGSDMAFELMTGWLNTGSPYYISDMTRASLRDLGYDVATLNAVPEISTALFSSLTLGFCLIRRKRR